MNVQEFFQEFFGAEKVQVISATEIKVEFNSRNRGREGRASCRINSNMSQQEIFAAIENAAQEAHDEAL